MLKLRLFCPLAVLILVICVLTVPVLAQNSPNFKEDAAGNKFDPALTGLGATTTTFTVPDPVCPNISVKARLSRPTRTGDDLLDEALSLELRQVSRKVATGFSLGADSLSDCPEHVTLDEPGEVTEFFEAHSPSAGILSVLFTRFESLPWAAHPNQGYDVLNYNLTKGQELTLDDLFPEGLVTASLWGVVAKEWCSFNDYKKLPSFYGLSEDTDWCAKPDSIPLPASLTTYPISLKSLGNGYLTKDGLVLQLGAYEGWSYADGPSTLLISKDTLKKLGAKASIWPQ
ncbi:MAG: hypothetical protein LBJ61_00500 [Deltaproteobacteria bacterium]|jgi:hypothetical protein|nr:hypothetical protein [Deltaproteobacteria bacterium]